MAFNKELHLECLVRLEFMVQYKCLLSHFRGPRFSSRGEGLFLFNFF